MEKISVHIKWVCIPSCFTWPLCPFYLCLSHGKIAAAFSQGSAKFPDYSIGDYLNVKNGYREVDLSLGERAYKKLFNEYVLPHFSMKKKDEKEVEMPARVLKFLTKYTRDQSCCIPLPRKYRQYIYGYTIRKSRNK